MTKSPNKQSDSLTLITIRLLLLMFLIFDNFMVGTFAGKFSKPTNCYVCRSRGPLGDCKDKFIYNQTTIKSIPGHPIGVTACFSGWCQKTVEGIRGPPDGYGVSTERSCMSKGPNDGEERCAEVVIRNRLSRLCVCRGNLCNRAASPDLFFSNASILLIFGQVLLQTIFTFIH